VIYPDRVLSQILGVFDVSVFLCEYFGQKPLHVTGAPGRFDSLLADSAITAILSRTGLSSSDQTSVPAHKPVQLSRELHAQKSIEGPPFVVERIDQIYEPVATLARGLERALKAPLRATLNIGPHGPVAHRERSDIIILQISGQTQYEVCHQAEIETQHRRPWNLVLKSGDVLYIPNGWSHVATSEDRIQQLSLTLDNPTGSDFVSWLVELLKQKCLFKKDVPRFSSPGVQADFIAAVRSEFARICSTPGLLERYFQYLDTTAVPRPQLRASQALLSLDRDWILISAARNFRVRRYDKDNVYFDMHGTRFIFPESSAELLCFLEDRAPISVANFFSTFDKDFNRDQLVEFLSDLANGYIVSFFHPLEGEPNAE
jgi:ribosomal protein L16 Arg81 hydroxylase